MGTRARFTFVRDPLGHHVYLRPHGEDWTGPIRLDLPVTTMSSGAVHRTELAGFFRRATEDDPPEARWRPTEFTILEERGCGS